MNDELKAEIAKMLACADLLPEPGPQVLRSMLAALELAIEQRDALCREFEKFPWFDSQQQRDVFDAAILAALRGEQ